MNTIYPKKNKETIKYTLYINSIGKKSDEFVNEIFYIWPWTRNPKILKGNCGTFKAKKYSFLLEPEDFYKLKSMIINRAKHVNSKEVHCLLEDKCNIFIIDRVNY